MLTESLINYNTYSLFKEAPVDDLRTRVTPTEVMREIDLTKYFTIRIGCDPSFIKNSFPIQAPV